MDPAPAELMAEPRSKLGGKRSSRKKRRRNQTLRRGVAARRVGDRRGLRVRMRLAKEGVFDLNAIVWAVVARAPSRLGGDSFRELEQIGYCNVGRDLRLTKVDLPSPRTFFRRSPPNIRSAPGTAARVRRRRNAAGADAGRPK